MTPLHRIRWLPPLLAAFVSTLICLPFCQYIWTVFSITPFNPANGLPPVYVQGALSAINNSIIPKNFDGMWWFFIAFPEAFIAGLLGIIVYVLIVRVMPRRSEEWLGETRCRHCRSVLLGLVEARCPHCKSPL